MPRPSRELGARPPSIYCLESAKGLRVESLVTGRRTRDGLLDICGVWLSPDSESGDGTCQRVGTFDLLLLHEREGADSTHHLPGEDGCVAKLALQELLVLGLPYDLANHGLPDGTPLALPKAIDNFIDERSRKLGRWPTVECHVDGKRRSARVCNFADAWIGIVDPTPALATTYIVALGYFGTARPFAVEVCDSQPLLDAHRMTSVSTLLPPRFRRTDYHRDYLDLLDSRSPEG